MNGVAVVAVLTGGTRLLAVLTKEAFGAELVTTSPVPAAVTGDALPLRHLTGLLALTVPTPEGGQGRQEHLVLFITENPPSHVKLALKPDERNPCLLLSDHLKR